MAKIKFRRDTAAAWTQANPVLAQGEPGFEYDTGLFKIGDGETAWTALAYSSGGSNSLISQSSIQVETGDSDRWLVRLRREDQTNNPEWKGVVVTSTNYDSLGNAIVAAVIDLNNDGVVIAKFNPSGELVWKKSVGAVNNSYYLESNVVIDRDDNIIFAINPDDSQVKYIIKMNGETGAVLFSESFVLTENFRVTAIAVDSSDNIIIGGNFYFQPSDEDVGFVAKLNSTATSIVWQHSLMVDSGLSNVNCLEVDFSDNIIAAGHAEVEHTVDGNTTTDIVMLVAKITSTGSPSWQKSVALDDINAGSVTGISLDSVGNIYATGTYVVPTGEFGWGEAQSNTVVIFKMTTLGVVAWDRRVGPGGCSWVGVSTAVGSDGDLYLYASTYERRRAGEVDESLGFWNATLALARYNKTTGAVVWQSYFDNPNSQEFPGYGNDAPFGLEYFATDLMAVRGDKILIGGSVRLGQAGPDQFDTPWSEFDYFNQGFLAQFDTDATPWSAEGWTLSTSRIPGKLANTLVAFNGPIALQNDIAIDTDGSVTVTAQSVGVSVRRAASKINTWTFGKDGSFTAPANANIRLNQRQLGYANLYGLFPNDESDIWFESVCHDADGFAYALGSNWWNNGNKAYIYKFTPEGELVWKRQLRSGDGASFNVSWTGGVFTVDTVVNGGDGYRVGDRIVLAGEDFSGQDGVNSLILEVATISSGGPGDIIGGVDTVTIVSGVAPSGTSTASDVEDFNDNARCEVRSMTFDPVTGNPVVVISTPTYIGDTLDTAWSETVIVTIDSGSGTVVSTTTLKDEGDVYPYDVDVSATGKVAVVGEKFNEYAEYGSITPLAGSAVDKLWVTKADIDAEHFPGDQFSYFGDWWITGTGITDQAQVQNVNLYTGLTNVVRQGSGATFTIADNGDGTYGVSAPTLGGTNYRVGHKIKVLGTAIGGATPANDCVVTVNEINLTTGAITILGNVDGIAAGVASQAYNDLSGANYQTATGNPIHIVKFNADGTYDYYNNTVNGTNNYVVGDVITISGTQFAGGASPANNIVFEVAGVNGDNAPTSFTYVSGSIPSTHLLLTTNQTVDYTAGGAAFAIKQNLGGEAFIWTPDFNKAIGAGTSDWFSGVVWNAAGTSVYAVGSGRYEVNYNQALVVKFSSTGTIQHSKFVNDNMDQNSASNGAVALMANDSIVVVHQQYNNSRDETDEILVTKLDSNLNILWQQFIGVDSGDGWASPNSCHSVAVDPATDEILLAWHTYNDDVFDDDAIHIVKLDTDGEMIWKRMFGIHESDTRMSYEGWGNKALSIHGDQFTFVGYTDGPDDGTDNALIVTLPLDGTGVGLHGLWTYAEPKDDRINPWRLTGRTSTTFTPTVHSDGITDVNNLKYYYTDYPNEDFTLYPQTILSNQGGALEFADGSKQTFSTALVPQVKISAGRYTIRPEDSGRHILVESSNYNIVIPHWKKVTLPVGFTFTIVNISNNSITVENENQDGRMWISGGDDKTPYVGINDNGSGQMVTLMKIKEGTYSDDGEWHDDIWMIAGADIYNND